MSFDTSEHFDASVFGTTPPRTRVRNKNRMPKNGGMFKASDVAHSKSDEKKLALARANGAVNSPRSSMRKKKTEIRTSLRDAKLESSQKDERDLFDDTNIIIGSRMSSSGTSDLMTLGSSQPFRCLAASCISEQDFKDPTPKVKQENQIAKNKNKKRPKNRPPKPSGLDQRRLRYMQRLRQIIAAGNNKQIDADRSDTRKQRYDVRRNELIWLELQAWHKDCSITQQDQYLFRARQTLVADVLSFVSVFEYDARYLKFVEKLKTKIDKILMQMPSVVCEQCDNNAFMNGDSSYSSQLSEEDVDTDSVFSRENSHQEGQSSVDIGDISNHSFSDSPNDDPAEPREEHTKLLKHNILPDVEYMLSQDNAIIKVGEMLRLLCIVENLYPSSSALAKDCSFYKDETFQNKLESMCSWFNITFDLRSKFLSFMRILFSYNHSQTLQDYQSYISPRESCSDPDSVHKPIFLPPNISEDVLEGAIRTFTNRSLKQKSVKSLLHTFLSKHFRSLYRAKMNMMPNHNYMCYEETLETMRNPGNLPPHFTIGDSPEDRRKPVSAKLLRTFTPEACQQQLNELAKIFEHINSVFPESDPKICMSTCKEAIFEEAAPVSPSDDDSAISRLPPILPLYTFFPSAMFAVMRHCMHLRLEQAMPFFHNSAPSICLLTAKQLVVESKEMLECGLLARDLLYFFVIDICDDKLMNEFMDSITSFDEDLHSMITTYLDFVNTWLVRMLCDLPHAPRCFQDILEQEWEFANKISPCIDFESVVTCACRFIKISADIVNSTRSFLTSAVGALLQSQHPEMEIQELENSIIEEEDEVDFSTRHLSQSSTVTDLDKEHCRHSSLAMPQAGVLWFHRQRSESPHLSRHNSMLSTSSANSTAVSSPSMTSPSEFERQISSSSSASSSGSSVPFPTFKHSTSHLESQRRYLFELCRAVRELFHEGRERAIRILSFGKRLRKSLEPAIGFNCYSHNNDPTEVCSYCRVLSSLQEEGYMLVDFSDVLSQLEDHNSNQLNSMKKDLNTNETYIDLNGYWVFIPRAPKAENAEEDVAHLSPILWSLIKNALFSHLQPSKSNESSYEDHASSPVAQVQCLLFIKKPVMSSFNRVRRRSDVMMTQPGKTKGQRKKMKKPPKCMSESNLLCSHAGEEDCKCTEKCCEECSLWNGHVIKISDKDHDTHNRECINFLNVMCSSFELHHDITVILPSGDDLGITRKEFSNLFSPSAKLVVAQKPIVRSIQLMLNLFRLEIIQLCKTLMSSIDKSLQCLDTQCELILKQGISKIGSWDKDSRNQVKSEVNEVMQSCFNFGFEFIKEATRIMSGDFRREMDKLHMDFASQWMDYVLRHREKGKGYRPRWASQGLTFVVSIDNGYLLTLKENLFDDLKNKINNFMDHLIGEAPTNQRPVNGVSLSKGSKSLNFLEVPEVQPTVLRSLSNSSVKHVKDGIDSSSEEFVNTPKPADEDADDNFKQTPIERIREVVADLEEDFDERKYESKTIGRVTDTKTVNPIINLGVRTVNFRWQRGTKVGEGGFGKVYTCVNVDTGSILAMKEVKFQANDHQKIRSALDEFTNFEGIQHPNLVQYYGVELHRTEMYIFMEYCEGGTLEEMCKISLPEMMIRRYTSQILAAMNALHLKGIVHRDIKGSNIFLSSSGAVKLGDFGSALKLKDQYKTTPGEIVSHIGTTMAYTAPEVINGSETEGYGRAADVWSLGCVVIEMASGKKPWHELESFQIMFKVGSGNPPPIPSCLSEDGKRFVQNCTITSQKQRWTSERLMGHPFVKVATFDE